MSPSGFSRVSPGKGDPREAYEGLRSQALACTASTVGVQADGDPVFGVLMDMSFPGGPVTIVSLADGTTSMYTSSGGGVIGGGTHARVAAASRQLVSVAAAHRSCFSADWHDGQLKPGQIRLIALVPSGQLAAVADEEELVTGKSPLSPVFMAANWVITQLRIASGK